MRLKAKTMTKTLSFFLVISLAVIFQSYAQEQQSDAVGTILKTTENERSVEKSFNSNGEFNCEAAFVGEQPKIARGIVDNKKISADWLQSTNGSTS